MPASFLHGVEIIDVTNGPIPVRTLRSSVIGIVGTAPDADETAFPLNTPVLIAGSRTEAAKLGAAGTLPDAIEAILLQAGAAIVVVRVEWDVDVESGVVADGMLTAADSVLGVTPRLLLAPGFSHEKPIADALISVAERLKGIALIDGPNTTDAAAIAYRNDFDAQRGFLVDPWVKIVRNGVESVLPPSPFVAGLIAKIDADKGFWWSPSNTAILGVTGTVRPIDFLLGDENSRANILNEKQITTIIRQNGYRLWGNRTLQATSPLFAFLPVRRTADIINESIKLASFPFVDQPISKVLAESIVETVNAYLRSLVSRGAILGGECWFDRDANGNLELADGKIRFRYKFQPPTPAEHIIYESSVVTEYFDVLFA
jgi:phage tail sheath protein FI